MTRILSKLFGDLPLQVKLTLIIFLSSFFVSVVGMIVYANDNLTQLRARILGEAQVIARTVATYSAADLAFRDKVAAQETLSGLEKIPHVVNAFLFDETNELFARLKSDPAPPLTLAQGNAFAEFHNEFLHVSEPVRYQDKHYGLIYVLFSLEPLRVRIDSAWRTFAAMLGAIVLLSLLLALVLQRVVSKPIHNLAIAATRVSSSGDYTIKVEPNSNDEIGELARAFNTMLDQINLRESERRVAIETASQLNTELEQRVVARTEELASANKELESFSYSVSHDLRAPLRSIDGFAHALDEDFGQQLDPVARGYLERIRRATQRMGMLIDDLLDLSRVSRTPIRRETVNLSFIAKELADDIVKRDPEHNVDVEIANQVSAIGDPVLLRSVMQNLLENAWKYTRFKPHARIEFGTATVDGVKCMFVRDNGAGFDMKYASRLFVPFQRLHSQQEFEGSGIGLATAARIIKRHGGRIWAEGKVNAGATFYFTLNEKQF